MRTRVSFVLMAAGSGSRLGGEPKQCRKLGGMPLWLWSARVAENLYNKGVVDELVVATSPEFRLHLPDYFQIPCKMVLGGDTRAASVANALQECTGELALIHDAARPFLTEHLCEQLILSAAESGAAVPLLPSVDSIKQIDEQSVPVAIPRESIFRAQTPQAFRVSELESALKVFGLSATDETECWTAEGKQIATVGGLERNFKITTAYDWMLAQALVNVPVRVRTGHGFDIHPLVPGRPLVLGGVTLDSSLGLDGHSDADVICHAVADALLGAAGEPDIGTLFPASDAQYKNADSAKLLALCVGRILLKGFSISWVDITLQAQVPRLSKHLPIIKKNLEEIWNACGITPCLNIKVKSGEFVGSVGRGECMVCHALATLEERGEAYATT